MAYDAARQEIVLVGGWRSREADRWTWIWNGERWIRAALAPAPGMLGARMAYDAAREKVVMFQAVGDQPHGSTWEWDGNSWTLVATTGPSRRSFHVSLRSIFRRLPAPD